MAICSPGISFVTFPLIFTISATNAVSSELETAVETISMLKIPLNGLLLFCIILFSQNPNYVISKINLFVGT